MPGGGGQTFPRAQLMGAMVVYMHSYFTVFHPALHSALPPATGWFWFFLYTVIFTSMTFLARLHPPLPSLDPA